MQRSIGYGAYDSFGEANTLYKGADPIRFARGTVEIKEDGDAGPKYKRYTFEGGLTPLGIFFGCAGGGAFLYLLYRVFYKGE